MAVILTTALLHRNASADEEPAESSEPAAEAPPPVTAPKREMPSEWSEPTPSPPKPRWHPNMSLVLGGLASFTIGYVPALGVAAASFANKLATSGGGIGGRGDEGGAMVLALPVGGPFFFAASDAGDGVVNRTGLSGEAKALLYTSGVLQAGGVLLMGLGFALGKETPVRVAPMGSPGISGISVAIDRW